jgi:hypothetical protein
MAISFVDCINHGDVERQATFMHQAFELRIFGEPPSTGTEGWRGYANAYSSYLIHPHRMAVVGETAAIVGHTTGSHLELPDEEEAKLTLIWLSEVRDGKVLSWTLTEDTPEARERWGLAT